MTLSLGDPDLLGVVVGSGGIGAIACLLCAYGWATKLKPR